MECYRIDESGYTGFDLLNADQRFQGASAVAVGDDDASRLIKEHFPKLQAKELKYRSLSRRSAHHPRLLALIGDVLSNYKCVTYVCDKRFMLSLMFVDYGVEPFYYENNGPDLYENGANYGMASLLHIAGPALLGKSAFDEMMVAFQFAMKEKSGEAISKLVRAARATNWRELPEVMGPLAQFVAPECISAIAAPGVDTDIAIVVLQSLISRMEVMADGPYRVEHDQSKNLTRYNELIRRYIEHDIEIEFKATEIASLKFPLKLAEITQVDSKSSPAVQIADVLVGAAVETANNLSGRRNGGLDPDALMALYRDDQFISLFPSSDFEEQRRFRQGSQTSKMVDYVAQNILLPR